jgi:hypothetical protein
MPATVPHSGAAPFPGPPASIRGRAARNERLIRVKTRFSNADPLAGRTRTPSIRIRPVAAGSADETPPVCRRTDRPMRRRLRRRFPSTTGRPGGIGTGLAGIAACSSLFSRACIFPDGLEDHVHEISFMHRRFRRSSGSRDCRAIATGSQCYFFHRAPSGPDPRLRRGPPRAFPSPRRCAWGPESGVTTTAARRYRCAISFRVVLFSRFSAFVSIVAAMRSILPRFHAP